MKLPTVQEVAARSGAAMKRFPFVLLSAACASAAGIALVEVEQDPGAHWLASAALAAVLGIPLTLTLSLVLERRRVLKGAAVAAQLLLTALLAGYAFSLPRDLFTAPSIHIIRFWMLLAGAHCAAAYLPFAGTGERRAFWQYNRTLLLRLLTAVLYSMVLYAGLSIALLSMEKLFSFSIDGERYRQLFLLIAGVFNTWFFLSGVPSDLPGLEHALSYPRGLKVFAQYILLPLVTIYLLILYAYGVKIVIAWDWPRGWVANLILGFSATGLLAVLLLWPLRDVAGQKWIRVFTRRSMLALAPLMVMLLLAVWRRIAEYGVTENRYFVVVLGLWLVLLCIILLRTKMEAIPIVPASLGALAFLTSSGPWGAFNMSAGDQMRRLEQILARNGILAGGVIRPPSAPVSVGDADAVSSLLRYLVEVHGTARLGPLFGRDFGVPGDSIATAEPPRQPRMLASLLGVEYVEPWEAVSGREVALFGLRRGVVSVTDFSFLVRGVDFRGPKPPADRTTFSAGGGSYHARLLAHPPRVVLRRAAPDSGTLVIDLHAVVDRRSGGAPRPDGKGEKASLSAAGSGAGMRALLLIEDIEGERTDSGITVRMMRGDLLFTDSLGLRGK